MTQSTDQADEVAAPLTNNARKRLPWPIAYQELKAHVEQIGTGEMSDLFGSLPRPLRIWASRQRFLHAKGALSPERIGLLEQIAGWEWGANRSWDDAYRLLQEYARAHNSSQIPVAYVTEDGFGLGGWAAAQRYAFSRGELHAAQIAELSAIEGWRWSYRESPRLTWAAAYSELKDYATEYQTTAVPWDYTTKDGFNLGRWVYTQRSNYAKNTLGSHKARQLEQLRGWQWDLREVVGQRAKTALDEFLESQGPFIDTHHDSAKYRQIADVLQAAIETGYYQPGDKLPTHPELSKRFGASRDTIRSAIQELHHAGLTVMIPSKGLFVADEPGNTKSDSQAAGTDQDIPQFQVLSEVRDTEAWAQTRQLIGARIREVRTQQKQSQAMLARLTGVSHTTIHAIELGNRSVRCERLFDIAAALRVPPHELLQVPSNQQTHVD
ncbi:putative helicase [Mycobacteroides abscessus subsp. abscessus]|uniref:Helicase associated domain protein n=1 Tax=Mycobacteroides abscessus TaxID=36809 RepID=UPI0009A89332|nr:Helicase associated domain protein [Mycobacteroides abscessus]SLI00663.1 putative helicase [Mycobacteroides abscessus subsp. abscessus]